MKQQQIYKNFVNFAKSILSCTLLLFCTLVYANQDVPKSSLPIQNQRIVKVGFYKFDGFMNIDEDEQKSGYAYDYLQNMAIYENWKFEYIKYDLNWEKLLFELENSNIDILLGAIKNPEREEKFAYSQRPLGLISSILTVKAGSTKYTENDYENWNGIRIGVIRGAYENNIIREFAEEKGFKYIEVMYDNLTELKIDLHNGEMIDAAVTNSLRTIRNEWIYETLDTQPFYAIVNKNNKKLLSEVNHAIEKIKTTNSNLHYALFQKHYSSKNSTQLALDNNERQFIIDLKKNSKTIKAVFCSDRRPFSYIENGEPKGIAIELVKKIAVRSELPIEFVLVENRAEYLKCFHDDKITLIADMWFDYPDAEKYDFILTEPYLKLYLSYMTNTAVSNPKGAIGVVNASHILKIKEMKYLNQYKIFNYPSIESAERALKKNEIDKLYLYTQIANYIAYKDKTKSLVTNGIDGITMSYCIAVKRSENPLMRSILNKAAISISEKEVFYAIRKNTTYPPEKFSLITFFHTRPLECVGILFCIFFIIFILIGLWIFAKISSYRNIEIVKKLPVRYVVADKYGKVLIYSEDNINKDFKIEHRIENINDFLDENITKLMRNTFSKVINTGKSMEVEFEINSKRHSAYVSKLPFKLFAKETAVWVSQDTTKLQQTKAQAQTTANRFLLTLKSIGDGVIVTDKDETVTVVNPIAAKMIGLSEEKIVGKKLKDVFNAINSKTEEPIELPVSKVLKTGMIVDVTTNTHLISKNGKRYHISDSAAPILDAFNNIVGSVLVFRDVTKEYKQLDKIREHNLSLETASKSAKMSFYVYDIQSQKYTTPFDSYYWPQENGVAIPAEEWIHPQDLPHFKKAEANILARKTTETSVEFRAGIGNNKKRFFHMHALLTNLRGTKNPQIIGSIREITEEKQQQLERDNANVLVRTIIDNIPACIVLKDIDKNFSVLFCNQYYADLLGMNISEIIGKNTYNKLK